MKAYSLVLVLLGLFFCSCEKTNLPVETVVGEWEWLSSYGGFAPIVQTPESEGYQQSLDISKTRYIHYQDGEETLNEAYTLTTEEYEDGTVVEYIEFAGFQQFVVEYKGDSLILWDTCADCFRHVYKQQ